MIRCIVLLWLPLAFLGCKKGRVASNSTPADRTSDSATSVSGGTGSDIEAPDRARQLFELTQAVRRYGLEQRRAPKTLEEVAAAGYLKALPEAPQGKKFAINSKLEVYIANR